MFPMSRDAEQNTEDAGMLQQSTEGHSDVPIEHRAPTGYKGHRNVKAEYKGLTDIQISGCY